MLLASGASVFHALAPPYLFQGWVLTRTFSQVRAPPTTCCFCTNNNNSSTGRRLPDNCRRLMTGCRQSHANVCQSKSAVSPQPTALSYSPDAVGDQPTALTSQTPLVTVQLPLEMAIGVGTTHCSRSRKHTVGSALRLPLWGLRLPLRCLVRGQTTQHRNRTLYPIPATYIALRPIHVAADVSLLTQMSAACRLMRQARHIMHTQNIPMPMCRLGRLSSERHTTGGCGETQILAVRRHSYYRCIRCGEHDCHTTIGVCYAFP